MLGPAIALMAVIGVTTITCVTWRTSSARGAQSVVDIAEPFRRVAHNLHALTGSIRCHRYAERRTAFYSELAEASRICAHDYQTLAEIPRYKFYEQFQ
jgi:hypothetical protein